MKMRIRYILSEAAERLGGFADRHKLILSIALSLLLAGALALYNVSSGPLHNLNDIGGWGNRALFIAMAAAAHAAVLIACALLSSCGFARVALRQVILTAGMYIMLIAINQKAYAYVKVLQPVIRAMDAGGLAAAAVMETDFSAPMLALLYLITRGPVYDMYLLKLFAIVCMMVISLLAMRAAERRGLGIRTEVLLALCMILPQGFMNAACSALPEIGAAALLAVSLALVLDADRPKLPAGMLCFGAACALSGAALYALPVYIVFASRRKLDKRYLPLALLPVAVCCLPAVVCGMPVLSAGASLLKANLGMAAYASGAPGLMNLIPRAAVEEMLQYAPTLSHFAELDLVTNAQQYYTQAHFEQLSAGFVAAGFAVYLGACALAYRAEDKSALHRAMILVLGALIGCPNATAAAWLVLDVLCLYAILAEKELRIPACMVLFATMCSASYPMTEEVLLPMVYAFALCLLAGCMLIGVIPMTRAGNKTESDGRGEKA